MPSVAEQILARAYDALIASGIAGGRIYRGNEVAFGEDELPAINIRRAVTETQSYSNGLERNLMAFDVENYTTGVAWETEVDALHMLSHAVLATDTQLAAIGRGLRCVSTEALGAEADFTAGKLVARYQIQFITRPSDLTRAIN